MRNVLHPWLQRQTYWTGTGFGIGEAPWERVPCHGRRKCAGCGFRKLDAQSTATLCGMCEPQ